MTANSKAIREAIAQAERQPGQRVPVIRADGKCIGYITVPGPLPPQECCVEACRELQAEVVALAQRLGQELADNGKRLSKLETGDEDAWSAEGRLRELAGMLFYNLAEMLWRDDRQHDDARRMAAIEQMIGDKISPEALAEVRALAKREQDDGGSP